ncbi:MAG: glycosyltransferase, partial [Fimbriiglobus sp.]
KRPCQRRVARRAVAVVSFRVMRISVALATFNGAAHLPDQLGSLAAQTRPPAELVACDDASTDGTVDILRAFARTAPFPVTVVVNPVRLGSTANFEQAFLLCTGDVISPCDQDDVWLPEKLARFAAALADPAVGFAFSDAWLADGELRKTGATAWQNLPFSRGNQRRFDRGRGPAVLLRHNVVTGTAMAFRADLRNVLLPIPTDWVHDAWVAFVAAAVSDVRTIPEPLVVYRRHPGQQIGLADRTLSRQIATATTARDAEHFEKLASDFDVLGDRLEAIRDRVRDPGLLAKVRAKSAFARERAALRVLPWFRRVPVAWGGLLAGDYHRFARGWKAFAADVLLARTEVPALGNPAPAS